MASARPWQQLPILVKDQSERPLLNIMLSVGPISKCPSFCDLGVTVLTSDIGT